MNRYFMKAAALTAVILLTGCGNKWADTEYSISDIQAMRSSSCSEYFSDKDEDDLSAEALECYNKMLGFVENYMNVTDYRVYDFYYVHFDSVNDYVIKIVLPEYEDELEKNDEAAVMLTCDPKTMQVHDSLGNFMFARSWTEKLKNELAEEFPDYHMNTEYLLPDHICQPRYKKDADKVPVSKIGQAIINIFVQPGTAETEADSIYVELRPLLEKYAVESVNIAAAADDAAMAEIISSESFTGNIYYYSYDRMGIDWLKSYSVWLDKT